MKLNQKNLPISRPQEYIKLANSLFNISRQLKQVTPVGVEIELNVCGEMLDISINGRPPFFAGASCSGCLKTDESFADSLGLDLHNYLKSR